MANWQSSIAKSIKRIAGTVGGKVDVFYASVDSVNIPGRTCSCTMISGTSDLTLTTVNLMAEVNDGILNVPTVGSTVYILSSPEITPFVDVFSQIDQKIYIVGDTEFSMVDGTAIMQQGEMTVTLSNGMINIKNDSKNFTEIMQNILNHIQALTVSTGTGPSSVPINLSDFVNDLSDLNEILN